MIDVTKPLAPIPLIAVENGNVCSICWSFYCSSSSNTRIIKHISESHVDFKGVKSSKITSVYVQRLTLRTQDPYFAVTEPSIDVNIGQQDEFLAMFGRPFDLKKLSQNIEDQKNIDMLYDRAYVKLFIERIGSFEKVLIDHQSCFLPLSTKLNSFFTYCHEWDTLNQTSLFQDYFLVAKKAIEELSIPVKR